MTVPASRAIVDTREFVPFRAAFEAGARLAMSAHVTLPAVTGRADLPSTLSRAVMTDLLRHDLGFEGITISDALDMAGVGAGPDGVPDVAAAIRAGVDLLLVGADPEALDRIERTLVEAADGELLDPAEVAATERRLAALREWLAAAGPPPDLSVVGGAAHRALADELATRSITLVRDPGGLLPVRAQRVLAVMPRPTDLTPADTSSTVAPALAAALRRYHADVDEVVVEPEPDAVAIAAVRERARGVDLVVIGTIDAHRLRSQLDLVEAVAATGTPAIAVAMRGPWDVADYPAGVTRARDVLDPAAARWTRWLPSWPARRPRPAGSRSRSAGLSRPMSDRGFRQILAGRVIGTLDRPVSRSAGQIQVLSRTTIDAGGPPGPRFGQDPCPRLSGRVSGSETP